MKIRDELVGRDVLDGTGHKIGEVDDIEVDFESKKIDAIILGEGKIIGRGNERRIPFNMVETVAERVILRREGESRTEGREEGGMGREERGRDKPYMREERY